MDHVDGEPGTLRLLLVEDSDDDTELLVREVRRAGYELEWLRVQTADELQRALAERAWDLVISDYSLPRLDAPAALRMVQATGSTSRSSSSPGPSAKKLPSRRSKPAPTTSS